MNVLKRFAASQGLVAHDSLNTLFKREIFFPTDPAVLQQMNIKDEREKGGKRTFPVSFDPSELLKLLPDEEAEIFWLLNHKSKSQKDVAVILKMTQPTVSYRYRRTLVKISYLSFIRMMNVDKVVNSMDFLSEREKLILVDLFYTVNQEFTGRKFELRQSSVKWVLVKAKRRLLEREKEDPEAYFSQLSAVLFLEKNLAVRVRYS